MDSYQQQQNLTVLSQDPNQQQQQQAGSNSISMLSSTHNNNNNNNNNHQNLAMNFFQQQQQQQQGFSRRNSDADIGAMDEVQFTASLDALLNDQYIAPPSIHIGNHINAGSTNSACNSNSNHNNGFPSQQQQFFLLGGMTQHATNNNDGQSLVVAQPPQQHQQQQQQLHQQQHSQQQLSGLPLASANQAGLQLVPPGPHSAAQMSLSAGHAAATGAFHPGNLPGGATAVALAPQMVAAAAAAAHNNALHPTTTTSSSSCSGANNMTFPSWAAAAMASPSAATAIAPLSGVPQVSTAATSNSATTTTPTTTSTSMINGNNNDNDNNMNSPGGLKRAHSASTATNHHNNHHQHHHNHHHNHHHQDFGSNNDYGSNNDFASIASGTKRPRGGGGGGSSVRDASAVSEDEGERERRRYERNLREQQRSHRITEQIADLREVLSAANVQFKPDKYSTLTKVAEYIQQLQDRSKVLDAEHRKLLDTISETNEIVNNQYIPAYTSGSDAPSMSNNKSCSSHHHHHNSKSNNSNNNLIMADCHGGSSTTSTSVLMDDESMANIRGIDYKIAFTGCGIPLALASIDGRFLDCNDTFLELTGYTRDELLPLEKSAPGHHTSRRSSNNNNTTVSFSPDQNQDQKKNLSLFNLLCREGMEQVFAAMSEMLKQPGSIGTVAPVTRSGSSADASANPNATSTNRLADFWSGPVKLCRQDNLPVKLNMTLVRTSRGRPKFFNCALTALAEENEFGFDDQTTLTSSSQSRSDDVSKLTITSTSGDIQPNTGSDSLASDSMQQKSSRSQSEPVKPIAPRSSSNSNQSGG